MDRTHRKKSETRGDLPKNQNGVRIEIEEKVPGGQLHATCDYKKWPKEYNFVGGQRTNPAGGGGPGTNSSQVIQDDFDWFGWSTAGHVGTGCEANNETVYHNGRTSDAYEFGSLVEIDTKRDLAFIYADKDDPSAYNFKPTHDESVKIQGTVTEEGFAVVDEEYDGEERIFLYGTGSCFTDGQLYAWNETVTTEWACTDTVVDQMKLDYQGFGEDPPEEGDSGGLYFVEDPNYPGDWYAMGSHAGLDNYIPRPYGPQGFSIHEAHNRFWKN